MYWTGTATARPVAIGPSQGTAAGGEIATDAAQAILEAFVGAVAAQGALLRIQNGREFGVVHAAGALTPFTVPPAAPFMLSDSQHRSDIDGDWRQGDDGVWLSLRIVLAAEGRALCLDARFASQPADGCRQAAALLMPSLKALGSALESQRDSARRLASYEMALNRSELAIMLLDCDGALLFANRLADAMLDKGDCLRRKGAGVGARDLSDAIRLQVAIEHVCSGDGSQVEDPIVSLKLRHPLRPLLACVSPAAIEGDPDCDTGAIVRIIDPNRELQPFLEPVCAHYRLSPVETRLALQIARGATIETASDVLRIKPQTARSYLKQIFLKTDTNRQSELVRLLLSSTVRARPAGRFRIV